MRIETKICGLTSAAAVDEAARGGASFVGFVFYPPSPRSLVPAAAGALTSAVPQGVRRVGLFVDAEDATIAAVLAEARLDLLQFHGREPPQRVAQARDRFGLGVIKAVAIAGPDDLAIAERYENVADMLLFDAKPPRRPDALPGGNGLAFDWQLISGRRWACPWMLSGGLTTELLPEAVRLSGAQIVDVSSGVESAPGRKDLEKIRCFLAAARAL
jgi:phosphoribosylanthranilate isomerase